MDRIGVLAAMVLALARRTFICAWCSTTAAYAKKSSAWTRRVRGVNYAEARRATRTRRRRARARGVVRARRRRLQKVARARSGRKRAAMRGAREAFPEEPASSRFGRGACMFREGVRRVDVEASEPVTTRWLSLKKRALGDRARKPWGSGGPRGQPAPPAALARAQDLVARRREEGRGARRARRARGENSCGGASASSRRARRRRGTSTARARGDASATR